MQLSKALAITSIAGCFGCGGIARATTLQFAISNLGAIGPTNAVSFSKASAINSAGLVTGTATLTNNLQHAFLYDGQMHDLGSLVANGESQGLGINNAGVVVGKSDASQGLGDAFYIDATIPNATMVDMGTLPNGAKTGSTAFGINNGGTIVGVSYHGSGGTNPNGFRYAGNTMTGLGDVEGSVQGTYYSGALAINNIGTIVGLAQDTHGNYEAFINAGSMQVLPSLPGDSGSEAYAINDNNVAVGQTGNNGGLGPFHAVTWIGGTVAGIGGLPGNTISAALGINNAAQIVGYAYTSNNVQHAFVYMNGTMTDINTIIAPGQSGGFDYLASANAINDSGTIVGQGFVNGRGPFAFIAVPNNPTTTGGGGGGGTGGGGGATNPVIVMSSPVLQNKQVRLTFTVTNLTGATFHLLQSPQANTSWTTNTAAVLTTNVLNSSYFFTATNTASTGMFYRVESP